MRVVAVRRQAVGTGRRYHEVEDEGRGCAWGLGEAWGVVVALGWRAGWAVVVASRAWEEGVGLVGLLDWG